MVSKAWNTRVQTALHLLSQLSMSAPVNNHYNVKAGGFAFRLWPSNNPQVPHIMAALKQVGPCLTSLHLQTTGLFDSAVECTCMLTLLKSKVPALTSLSLYGDNTISGSIKQVTYGPLADAIRALSSLQMLDLRNNGLQLLDSSTQQLALAAGSLPHLKHLNLSGNEVNACVLQHALHRASLVQLELRSVAVRSAWPKCGTSFGAVNLTGLEEGLKRQTALQVLDLGNNYNISATAGHLLARCMCCLRSLRKLTISSSGFDGEGTQRVLWHAISNMPLLESLESHRIRIQPSSCADLATALASAPGVLPLTSLTIRAVVTSSNDADAALACVSLASAVTCMPSLRALSFDDAVFGNAGAHLWRVLPRLSHLTDLSLQRCDLGGVTAWRELGEALGHLAALRVLKLRETKVDRAILSQVLRELPHLSVVESAGPFAM